MRKRRIRAAVLVCAYILFLLLMDYPYLSRLYNDIISGEVIASFARSEVSADCEKRLSWAESYNRYLAGEGACPDLDRAWTKSAHDSSGQKQEQSLVFAFTDNDKAGAASDRKEWMRAARVLCLEDSDLAGWIRIPALDLILPLFTGTQDEALNKGAGILEGSSLPVGGESTHACISAHRGLPDRTLFTNLDMLRSKDRIEVHTLGRTICYEIFGSETVRPSDTKALAICPGQDLLTLITCTPYGINTHRLYVHARRCSAQSGDEKDVEKMERWSGKLMDPVFWKLWWWVPATLILLVLLILLVRRSLR